ncbi:hypothetical protein [Nocardioides bruguierae]|uniref:hypothetical protein n=1 Tax=Nocardioides bruguierae TaxID=2945102 RepID=UPI0020228463|nr:hypothetical protein [Nocardioides bruguierae]MCL8025667.1 hypothetical protein [Nocardioides bruguierae]
MALTAGALSLLEYVGLDGGALVGVLDSLAQTALVWTAATAVVALVPPLAGEGRVLRWYSVGTLVLLSPVVLLDGAVAPLGPGGDVVVGLGAAAFILVEVVWFVSYLWRAAARPVDPRLVSPGPAAPAPGG